MANEIEILTVNKLGNSWVDNLPGDPTTGYQAQNTNIEAGRNGIDRFAPYYDDTSDEIVIPESGIVDEGGLPFIVKSEIAIDASGMTLSTKYYLRLIAGLDATYRSLSLVTTPGTYDASRNGFYESGDRILDHVFIKTASTTVVQALRITRNLVLYPMDQPLKVDSSIDVKDVNVRDTLNIDKLTLRYENLDYGPNVWENPTFDTTSQSTGSYILVFSNTIDNVLKRVGSPNGITGARFGFEIIHSASGLNDRIGYVKIDINDSTYLEEQYSFAYDASNLFEADLSLTANDSIAIYIRFVSGGDNSRIEDSPAPYLSFSRERTSLETLFNV